MIAKKKKSARTNVMPAASANATMKAYTVAPGFIIGDNNNNRCEGGDEIMLTHAQAKFLLAKRAIDLALPDEDDDDDSSKNSAGDEETTDAAKADAEGSADVGGSAESAVSAPKRRVR